MNDITIPKIRHCDDKKQLLQWKRECEIDLKLITDEMYECTPITSHPNYNQLKWNQVKMKRFIKAIDMKLNKEVNEDVYKKFIEFLRNNNPEIYWELQHKFMNQIV